MDSPSNINLISLCAGIGGLDLGVELATGGSARCVCYVEREAFASAILAARMEEAALASAPVWSDLRSFDGKPWRGIVDGIIGGYPCQPFSFAGQRRGQGDPRHLWPSIARIVEEVQPGFVFFENVAGHVTLGFSDVRRELEGLGYRVTAGLFTAAEVGAPHKRERLFILGVMADGQSGRCGVGWDAPLARRRGHADRGDSDVADTENDHRRRRERGAQEGVGENGSGRRRLAGGGGELADANGNRDERLRERSLVEGAAGQEPSEARERQWYGNASHSSRDALADASGARPQGRERFEPHGPQQRIAAPGSTAELRGSPVGNPESNDVGGLEKRRIPPWEKTEAEWQADYDQSHRSGEINIFPPGPGDVAAWRAIIEQRPDLAPATQPAIRRIADGSASRLDRLRATGNGVVPLVAGLAFASLWACIREEILK